MTVGVLEYRDEEFIFDVVTALADLKPEFIHLSELPLISKAGYRVIIDRLGFENKYLREYLKLASLGGCYVINNPFSSEVNNKLVEMKVCGNLGIPFPKTIMLPLMKEKEGCVEYLSAPDWRKIREEIRFPAVLKPHDGSAWEHVYEVNSIEDAEKIYDALKDRHILMLQEKIAYTDYYRAYCLNKKEVLFVKYEPAPNGLGKYYHANLAPLKGLTSKLRSWTLKLNRRIDFDFNSVEWCIDKNGKPYMIDAFNEVPDIDKNIFPDEEYRWLVDHFAKLVRDKLKSREKNRTL